MIHTAPAPYRAMLHLFPRHFLVQYGPQMEGLFVQMLADRRDHPRAKITLWFRALWDVLVHATMERTKSWRRGTARPASGRPGQ